MRVVVSDAEYFDDNLLFNVEDIQKNKTLSKAPLRLTQNIRVGEINCSTSSMSTL
jgi:hypothetical protein